MKILKVNEINEQKSKEIEKMVKVCFDEFVGKSYSQKGKNTFNSFSSAENLRNLFYANELLFTAEDAGEIIGFLCSAKERKHVALLFVDKKYHRRGIAKGLFHNFLKEIANEKTEEITVNSSPFAIKAYEKLGFVQIGEVKESNNSGIIAAPMRYKVKKGK